MAKPRMDLSAYWQAPRRAGWRRAAGGYPGAVAGVDGNRSRRPDWGRAARAQRGPHGLPEWLPNADVRHPRGHHRAADSEGAAWDVLPLAAAAVVAGRARPLGRGPGSIRARRVDAEGRRADEGPRPGRGAEVGGLSHLQRARSARRGISDAGADDGLPVPLGRCDVPQKCGSTAG